jgi:hypothetical protein
MQHGDRHTAGRTQGAIKARGRVTQFATAGRGRVRIGSVAGEVLPTTKKTRPPLSSRVRPVVSFVTSESDSGGGGTRTPKGLLPADFESAALPIRLRLRVRASSECPRATQVVPLSIGETGFEPATPASRTQCSTGLSYSPSRLSRSCSYCTDREGFEPSRAVNPTRFPIVLLKPLGHLSSSSAGSGPPCA